MYKIDFNKEASTEMQEAYEWYENNLTGLGERFFDTLDVYLEKICESPEQYQVLFKKKRAVYLQGLSNHIFSL